MSFDQLFLFLIQYRYFILFPLATIEGPITTMVAGFLIALGYMNSFAVFAIVLAGDLISDSAFYFLGKSGRSFLRKIKWFEFPEERLRQMEVHYQTHPHKTFAVSKALYGGGAVLMAGAGAAKMGYLLFLRYITIPNAVRSLLLLLIGYFSGQGAQYFDSYLHYYAIAVIIFLPSAYFIYRWLRQKNSKPLLLEAPNLTGESEEE